jgi:hypothetical protein
MVVGIKDTALHITYTGTTDHHIDTNRTSADIKTNTISHAYSCSEASGNNIMHYAQ